MLNVDYNGVREYKQLHEDKLEQIISQSVAFACAAVGIDCITESNYIEFATRMRACEMLSGSFTRVQVKKDQPYVECPITLSDVRRRIGLRTNAATLTDIQFKKALASSAMNQALRVLEEAANEQEKRNHASNDVSGGSAGLPEGTGDVSDDGRQTGGSGDADPGSEERDRRAEGRT